MSETRAQRPTTSSRSISTPPVPTHRTWLESREFPGTVRSLRRSFPGTVAQAYQVICYRHRWHSLSRWGWGTAGSGTTPCRTGVCERGERRSSARAGILARGKSWWLAWGDRDKTGSNRSRVHPGLVACWPGGEGDGAFASRKSRTRESFLQSGVGPRLHVSRRRDRLAMGTIARSAIDDPGSRYRARTQGRSSLEGSLLFRLDLRQAWYSSDLTEGRSESTRLV